MSKSYMQDQKGIRVKIWEVPHSCPTKDQKIINY